MRLQSVLRCKVPCRLTLRRLSQGRRLCTHLLWDLSLKKSPHHQVFMISYLNLSCVPQDA